MSVCFAMMSAVLLMAFIGSAAAASYQTFAIYGGEMSDAGLFAARSAAVACRRFVAS